MVPLVLAAVAVADGELPNLDALLAQVVDAETRPAQHGDRADDIRAALLPTRVTPLDPKRPARDLLEDLLGGIRGC